VLPVRLQHHKPWNCADPHRAVVPGTVDAVVVLQTQDMTTQSDLRQKTFKVLTWMHIKVEDILGRRNCISQVP
jgi:hypothetical protein